MRTFSASSLSPLRTALSALLLFVLAALPSQVMAQGEDASPPSSDELADQMIAAMTQELSLSEEQQEQIQPIVEDAMEKQRALMQEQRDGEGSSPKALREEMQQIQRDTDQRLAEVFTEEQMKTYEKARQQQAQGRQQAPQGSVIDAALQQLDARLDLTDEQQAELRPVLKNQMQKVQQMQQQQGSTQEEQRAAIEEMRQMQAETNKKIEAVLTEEQLTKYRELQRQAMQRQQQRMQQQQQAPTPQSDDSDGPSDDSDGQ